MAWKKKMSACASTTNSIFLSLKESTACITTWWFSMQHSDCGMYTNPDWIATPWICKSSILVKLYCHFKLNCLEVLLLCTPKKKGEIFARILHILARWENSHLEKQNFKNRSITPNQGRTLFSFNWNITSIYLREISFLLQIIYLWIFIIY